MIATQHQPATPESVWAMFQETDRIIKEIGRRQEETDRIVKENAKAMKELQKTVGGWENNHGSFAEEYFFNSFENGEKTFFGKKFDEIEKGVKNTWKGLRDEYDIVLYNDMAVAIIEVKYKAHTNDIPDVLKKAETFRILFPNYKDFKIYLGLASMSFYSELEQECINEGIAVIKQVGDSVVINDTNVKVF